MPPDPPPVPGPSPQARGSLVRPRQDVAPVGSIPAGAGKPQCGRPAHSGTWVHPRRRGEATDRLYEAMQRRGPSPQARGSRDHRVPCRCRGGSIPAGAGKPKHAQSNLLMPTVHPRRRGEAVTTPAWIRGRWGPSPQARGSPARARHRRSRAGSIPAGAGKPWTAICGCRRGWVHPRRRGEAGSLKDGGFSERGPSPQARGSRSGFDDHVRCAGSIPAGAGKPVTGSSTRGRTGVHPRRRGEAAAGPAGRGRRVGSIPAGAGKPTRATRPHDWSQVHPRRRGEAGRGALRLRRIRGPSPQARGSLDVVEPPSRAAGSIPAGAGKPLVPPLLADQLGVHPRRRGEAHMQITPHPHVLGPSPQARGSRPTTPTSHRTTRSIPAGAGKPRSRRRPAAPRWVHPRRRGEATPDAMLDPDSSGPSPQARGSRVGDDLHHPRLRSIPAGAGKPGRPASLSRRSRVHPRRRGEARTRASGAPLPAGPSPQARGSLVIAIPPPSPAGSIPAGAGKPPGATTAAPAWRVHPRRRGEAEHGGRYRIAYCGPSPQARGSRVEPGPVPHRRRSIPAGAGKPVRRAA